MLIWSITQVNFSPLLRGNTTMMDDDIRPTGATPTTPQVPGAAIAAMLARHEIRRAERIAAQEPVPDDTPAAVEGPHI